MYTSVIWEPYTDDAIHARYPGGISDMCTRHRRYWMTKSKIIFDVYVEEMAQQRVIRQFGLYQEINPPLTQHPLPSAVHGYIYLFYVALYFTALHVEALLNYVTYTVNLVLRGRGLPGPPLSG